MDFTVTDLQPTCAKLVDPAALEVPFAEDLPTIDKSDAARLLDGALRHLAVARGGVERQIGRRLLALKRMNGFEKLGASSPGDYIIERTGMSVSSAQEIDR